MSLFGTRMSREKRLFSAALINRGKMSGSEFSKTIGHRSAGGGEGGTWARASSGPQFPGRINQEDGQEIRRAMSLTEASHLECLFLTA